MKKVLGIIWVIAGILCLSSCSMKECKCISTNVVIQNDSIVSTEVDTVHNSTRGECEDFNIDEVENMETNIFIHHILECK